jgi:pyruvate/2-oxoglutarate dehydrogenase complex dihydrolipoamide acyltransferase (E2) component
LPDTAVYEDQIRTNAWKASNADWYGKDAEKTQIAQYVDQKLKQHGVNPIQNPGLYWQYLDQGIAELAKQASDAKAAQAKTNTTPRVSSAAPATATARGGERQTVKLTALEQKFARDMGIDPKDYAKEKALMRRERAK